MFFLAHSPRRTAKPSSRPKAFTLVELLVVIAIISILAAILFPVFGRARENARRTSCQSNMKQIGLSLQMYSQDYDERLVSGQTGALRWPQLLDPYIKNRGFVRCPSANYTPPVSTAPVITYDDAIANGAGNGGFNDYYYGLYPSYGYNHAYLSPHKDCPNGFDSAGNWTNTPNPPPSTTPPATGTCTPAPTTTSPGAFSPNADGRGINLAQLDSPSQTVAMADTANVSGGMERWGYFGIRAPQAWLLPSVTTYSDTFGRLSVRHLETTNVLFADGHVKAMKLDALRDPNLWRAKKM